MMCHWLSINFFYTLLYYSLNKYLFILHMHIMIIIIIINTLPFDILVIFLNCFYSYIAACLDQCTLVSSTKRRSQMWPLLLNAILVYMCAIHTFVLLYFCDSCDESWQRMFRIPISVLFLCRHSTITFR